MAGTDTGAAGQLLQPVPATMMALTFSTAKGTARLQRDYPLPLPRPGEVLVRVLRAGICSTVRCDPGGGRSVWSALGGASSPCGASAVHPCARVRSCRRRLRSWQIERQVLPHLRSRLGT